jgi:hypothetical protein
MPTKTKNSEKTEKIQRRLEELKKAARPAATESDISTASINADKPEVKPEVGDTEEEFVLDGAAKFTWMVDGTRMEGQYRINDTTLVIADPVVGYTVSMPISLPLAIAVQGGIGKLVDLERVMPKIPAKLKLRRGEFIASMAFPWNLPRIAWRVANRSVVWAIIQYMPMKNEWRVLRLRSTPRQTVYEAQQIMRHILGDNVYAKLKEAIELLASPL